MTRPSTRSLPKAEHTAWDEAWDAFLLDGKSGITQANYRSYAKKIDAFRAVHGVRSPDDFTDALAARPGNRWRREGLM
jgi:hypothetical protein